MKRIELVKSQIKAQSLSNAPSDKNTLTITDNRTGKQNYKILLTFFHVL
jgi:hypothetical protein